MMTEEEIRDADADVKRQQDRQKRERKTQEAAESAEFFRETRLDADTGCAEIRAMISAHRNCGRRHPIKLVQIERERLGRDLTLFEMWTVLQPDDGDIKSGFSAAGHSASVSDVLDDDWSGWNPDYEHPPRDDQINAAKAEGLIE